MTIRLWYPQLDIYDCIRRMGLLLSSWSEIPVSIERFYICDFYLANPPLIYATHMTQSVRKEFTELQVPKPDKTFLSYPSSQLLFHKMEPIQKQALQTVTGKGLIDEVLLKNGFISQSALGKGTFSKIYQSAKDDKEKDLAQFLTTHYAGMAHNDMREFRRHSGLRRVS